MSSSNGQGSLVLAARAAGELRRQLLSTCFDSDDLESRPTTQQQEFFDDLGKVQMRTVFGGNRCLAKGTLVATPRGPVAIELLRPGDLVYDENGKEIVVKQTFANGVKEVADFASRRVPWARCTADHIWLTETYSRKMANVSLGRGEARASEMMSEMSVVRQFVRAPLGPVHEPHAYLIGAFAGDGCCRDVGRRALYISSLNRKIPAKCAAILETDFSKCSENNHTWKVDAPGFHHYDEWLKGRYAHQKVIDLDVVKTWDRQSLVAFVAGVYDTDGSITIMKDGVRWAIDMQARSVLEAVEYALLALWQIPIYWSCDDRPKYKNGPVWGISFKRADDFKRMWEELDEHVERDEKAFVPAGNNLGGKRSRPGSIHLTWGEERRFEETFDIHVDSPKNLYLLANGLVTHNSGKTQCPARELGWILTDTHPTWVNPWGAMTVLIAAQDLTAAEAEIWRNKLSKFVNPSDWREIRQGQVLKRLVHKEKGHQVIFLSHGSSSEDDIKHLQMYTAHYVWIDEAPRAVRVVEELFQRVSTTHGFFVATMTLKARDPGTRRVREYLENLCDGHIGKIYRLSRLQNPKFKGFEAEELKKVAHLPKDLQQAVLEGIPVGDDLLVYEFNPDVMVVNPPHYRVQWRHVLSVDPATESQLGMTVWAEDPKTGCWFCVIDDYIEGIRVPSRLVKEVERRVEGLNIVKRIYDPAEGWYAGQAREAGFHYVPVRDKSHRTDLMRANLQEALGLHLFLTPQATRLRHELETCQRSDTNDSKIANASKYHLLDTARYFWDGVPRGEVKRETGGSYESYLIDMDDARRRKEHLVAEAAAKKKKSQRARWRSWRTR